jgi:hypothetical protein
VSVARFSWKHSPLRGEQIVEVDAQSIAITLGVRTQRIEFEHLRSVNLIQVSALGVPVDVIYLVTNDECRASFGSTYASPASRSEFRRAASALFAALDSFRPGIFVQLSPPTRVRVFEVALYVSAMAVVAVWSIISLWPLSAGHYVGLAIAAAIVGVVGFQLGSASAERRILASELAMEWSENFPDHNPGR